MTETTRAAFLSRGARGGLALVARCSLAEGTALAAPTADTDIAKLAATAELPAIDFYSQAFRSAGSIAGAPSFPKALTAAQATAAVKPCLAA